MPKHFIFPIFSHYFTISFFLHPLFPFIGGFLVFQPPFSACMDLFCGFVCLYQLPFGLQEDGWGIEGFLLQGDLFGVCCSTHAAQECK